MVVLTAVVALAVTSLVAALMWSNSDERRLLMRTTVRVDATQGPCGTESVRIIDWLGPRPPTDGHGQWIDGRGYGMPIDERALAFDAGWLRGRTDPVELSIYDTDPGAHSIGDRGFLSGFVLSDGAHRTTIQWMAVDCQ
jgi:hypothetical protein